ncbi:MAG: PD40 domain-containing protein [Anaerolineae bacterium]|nr:PD40 domain-containing protein [Anaerolineae bacterium]
MLVSKNQNAHIKRSWLLTFISLIIIQQTSGCNTHQNPAIDLLATATVTANSVPAQHINRTQPSWSPTGNEIAFRQITYDASKTLDSIWKIDITKNACVNLTPDYEGLNGAPIWSPDGNWIAFTSDHRGNLDVWIMRPDGSSLTNVTLDNPYADGNPVWSPDNKTIALESALPDETQFDIRLVNLATKTAINLTSNSGYSWKSPTWSPDGKIIAGIAAKGNDDPSGKNLNGIWLINITTQTRQNILQNDKKYSSVSWSPMQSNLALATEDLELQKLNVQNSKLTDLTKTGTRPVWSPNGINIAYYLRSGDNIDIGLMNWDGSNQTNLSSSNKGRNEFPSWSHDSNSIVFESGDNLGLSSDLWIVNSDGENLRKIACK